MSLIMFEHVLANIACPNIDILNNYPMLAKNVDTDIVYYYVGVVYVTYHV